MNTRNGSHINRLERALPEGLLVDSAWLTSHGYSTSLRSKYVSAGWLEQPARRVYRRPRGTITWQQVVLSLQILLRHKVVVGGRTALELQGYSHYLSSAPSEIHLFGPTAPPSWLTTLPLKERFVFHNSTPLFGEDLNQLDLPTLVDSETEVDDQALLDVGLRRQPWGQWDWPLTLSAPERAILELLDELPSRESFHQVDMLMEGLSDLSPRRLQHLLHQCRSVKIKRLFFFFADRHRHAWLQHLDRSSVDLGKGKRMLIKGGRLDLTYLITIPRDLEEQS
jgi:hypothetical protein